MKRHLDLVRELLLKAEADESRRYEIGCYERGDDESYLDTSLPALELYQLDKMQEAGLISRHVDDHDFSYFEITWAGHDYLDAVRDPGIWGRTKDAVEREGGSAALEVVKALAISFAKKQLEDRTGLKL